MRPRRVLHGSCADGALSASLGSLEGCRDARRAWSLAAAGPSHSVSDGKPTLRGGRFASTPQRERADLRRWPTKPPHDGATIDREGVPQHGSMRREPRPIGPAVRDQHPYRHRSRLPAPVVNDLARETLPPIHRAHEVVHVDDLRLELDHEQCPSSGVPRQDIDDTALPEDRVRHLRCQDPIREDPSRTTGPRPRGNRSVERRSVDPDRRRAIESSTRPGSRAPGRCSAASRSRHVPDGHARCSR